MHLMFNVLDCVRGVFSCCVECFDFCEGSTSSTRPEALFLSSTFSRNTSILHCRFTVTIFNATLLSYSL